MSFSELLSRPLPSKVGNDDNFTMEGVDDILDTPELDEPEMGDVEDEIEDDIEDGADDESTELTPEESQRVDDVMNTVATPVLISDEIRGEEEVKEFVDSIDSDIAVAEGYLTEKTIVKFDKTAKQSQLYEIAVAAVAREKKDPLYRKLETVYKMERVLKAKLRKKYHAEAVKKSREYLARARKSKSTVVAKAAKKVSGK